MYPIKRKADSTLMGMTKAELIEEIRCLENNWESAEWFNANQAKYCEKLLAQYKWIPVTERLPEDDLPKDTKKKMIRCLVYTDKGTVKPCVRQRWEHFNGQLVPWQWNKDTFAKPTHWMPLPQPPKEGE